MFSVAIIWPDIIFLPKLHSIFKGGNLHFWASESSISGDGCNTFHPSRNPTERISGHLKWRYERTLFLAISGVGKLPYISLVSIQLIIYVGDSSILATWNALVTLLWAFSQTFSPLRLKTRSWYCDAPSTRATSSVDVAISIFRKPWNGSCFQGQEKDTNNMVEYKMKMNWLQRPKIKMKLMKITMILLG